uniref:Neur_chan_memb domain-containing protein n=1 Tax=Macrostomum lignano TaxID=282301 RepID=A0A1I8IYR7_9PLAT
MCPMDLTYFPMDAQICSVEIESFGYTTKDIRYSWDANRPLEVSEDVRLPQYIVRGKRKRIREVELSTGNYSRLAAEFYFARSMGYYLIQIYIPSTLIVVLSWVSFWLSRSAVPARVALGITTVLTMTTLISSTNAALPKISYLKSIDVYLVTCFFMVFASLLEYAAVCYLEKCSNRLTKAAAALESSSGPQTGFGESRCRQQVKRGNRRCFLNSSGRQAGWLTQSGGTVRELISIMGLLCTLAHCILSDIVTQPARGIAAHSADFP